MNLNIGGARLQVTVPFDEQDFVRDVEESVNNLYNQWRHEFQKKTDREILSMVTYRFASLYYELTERISRASEITEECLRIAEGSVASETTTDADKAPLLPDEMD